MVTRLQVKVKTFFKEMQEMSEITPENPNIPGTNERGKKRRIPLVIFLGVLVSIEAMLVSAGALYFLSRIFLETPDNFTGAIVIFGITIIFGLCLFVVAAGTFKSKAWTRGAILTWQILQFPISISMLQGTLIFQILGICSIILVLLIFVMFFRAVTDFKQN